MRPIEIISPGFLVLTLAAVAVTWALPPRRRSIWLLAVSCTFYATWGLGILGVLALLVLVNYWLALQIDGGKSRALFIAGLTLNAFSLLLLKVLSGPYGFNLFARLAGEGKAVELTSVLLPIGFSFYVLQAISYLTDVYRGQVPAEKNLIHFALYLAYFPKLLAGPIERARSFLPQVREPRVIDRSSIEQGLYLILIGLLRKIVIADRLSMLRPADIFSEPENYTSLEQVIWLLVFAFALYNDFAGYTSIVRGVSSLLGIELSPNFKQPMFSRSFSDFWTRWHISLSEWLRDYIFYPVRRWLMRARWNRWLALLIPPLATMLVSGTWHGAYFTMLAWGLLHGLYLAVEQVLGGTRLIKGWLGRIYPALVFIGVTLAWIPFNASGMGGLTRFLLGLISPGAGGFNPGILPDIIFPILLSLWLDWQEHRHDDLAFPRKWKVSAQAWGTAIAIIFLILMSGTGTDLSGFVYQGF